MSLITASDATTEPEQEPSAFLAIRCVSIWPKDKKEAVEDRIQEKMLEVDDGDGVVILTDILGGTPTNVSLSLLKDEKVEVVTGVNMPMLMTLLSYRTGKSLREVSKLVKRSGRRSIILAKGVLGLERRMKAKSEMSK